MTPVALTIAGSDPSGGAGLQADLKTFHQFRVYGTSVVTLLTVQNTQAVSAVEFLDSGFVVAQLDAVLGDIPPNAAKTGALGNAAIIETIAERAKSFSFPLVVDPVMVSKHGASLIDEDAFDAFTSKLFPNAFLVTPNLAEASKLSGIEITDVADMEKAAVAIAGFGVKNILVKGGGLQDSALDVLWAKGKLHRLTAERVDTKHTHGTGCVLSSAITARLAHGDDVVAAVMAAKQFVTSAIRTTPGLGSGFGPVNLFSGTGL
jgi:hydroxymethylpyrimidine/phosphomethylpyrimidine kinase